MIFSVRFSDEEYMSLQNFMNENNINNKSKAFRKALEIANKEQDNNSFLKNVDDKFYITTEKMAKWTYLKGSKKIPRKTAEGHEYVFSEGPIAFPDPWDKPARTMLTSETTLNRSSHVVSDPGTGRLRTLTPVEAERIQGFDDGWTDSGMPDRMRYFCMGNALVVPMITRMGAILDKIIANED